MLLFAVIVLIGGLSYPVPELTVRVPPHRR